MERVPALSLIHADVEIVDYVKAHHPKVMAYSHRVRDDARLKPFIRSPKAHAAFIKSGMDKPDYDI